MNERRGGVADENGLLARAAAIRPLLAKNAASSEKNRRLADENISALGQAGLLEVMIPRRWGGSCATVQTYIRTSAELAKACPSSGWVHSVMNVSAWLASHLPDDGQEEIFWGGARPRFCSVVSPTVSARRVEGGYVLSNGRWNFASGCWHSNWAGLGFPIVDNGGKALEHGVCYIPMTEIEIVDNWFVAGMKATGSNSLTLEETFVPERRTLSFTRAMAGEYPARRHTGELSDRYALMPVFSLDLLGPILGAADAILESVSAGAHKRGISYTNYQRQTDSQVVHHHIGEAALKIDTAWLHTLRSAESIDSAARESRLMDYLTRARVRGDAGYAAQLVRDALDQLMSIAGAAAFAESNPLQRLWRDAHVGSRHAALNTPPNFELYGRALLGVEGNITGMI
ncbi:MAG: acyl-CoA dehydrogenase family protein [Candidatus Binataceae bacterium]